MTTPCMLLLVLLLPLALINYHMYSITIVYWKLGTRVGVLLLGWVHGSTSFVLLTLILIPAMLPYCEWPN